MGFFHSNWLVLYMGVDETITSITHTASYFLPATSPAFL